MSNKFWKWVMKDTRLEKMEGDAFQFTAKIVDESNRRFGESDWDYETKLTKDIVGRIQDAIYREVVHQYKDEILEHFKKDFMERYAEEISNSFTKDEIMNLTKESFRETLIKRLSGEMGRTY